MVHAIAVNSETLVNADVDLFEQGFDRCLIFFGLEIAVAYRPGKLVRDLPQEPHHRIAQSFSHRKHTRCRISCQP